MKHRLKKYLPASLAIIVSGTLLFNSLGDLKNNGEKSELTNFDSLNDSLTDALSSSEALSVATNSKSLSELKLKLKKLLEKDKEKETTSIFTQSEETTRDVEMKVKFVFDKLLNKYFNKIGNQEITMTCTVPKDRIFEKSQITINAKNIINGESFYKFLQELNDVCVIKTLNADSQSIAELQKYDINFINELKVYSESEFIGVIDLSHFENLENLSLEKVNVLNIPSSIKKISFNGKNHSQYNISSELKQIENLKNIWKLSFENIKVKNINFPEEKLIYLDFLNCEGNININVFDSEKVYISYCNNYSKKEPVIVNGKIDSNLIVVSNSDQIYKGNINGDPKISFSINDGEKKVDCEMKSFDEAKKR